MSINIPLFIVYLYLCICNLEYRTLGWCQIVGQKQKHSSLGNAGVCSASVLFRALLRYCASWMWHTLLPNIHWEWDPLLRYQCAVEGEHKQEEVNQGILKVSIFKCQHLNMQCLTFSQLPINSGGALCFGIDNFLIFDDLLLTA